jgi:hypothetical protein
MEERDKVHNIIKDVKSSTNKELAFAMDFLSAEYERTKDAILKLTKHLDGVEIIYNKVIKEHENRNDVKR